MRIGIVSEYYYPHVGGICEHVHYFAREARKRGHHVDIITGEIPGTPPLPNVHRVGESIPVAANGSTCRFTGGRGLRSALRALLRRERYDLLHVHAPLAPALPMIALEEAECPVVGTFHAYHDRSLAYLLGRRYFQGLMDRIDASIAVSAAARDAVAKYFSTDWTIIPNGVDTTLFNPEAPPAPSVPSELPVILFVGRFDPRNGLGALLSAFKLLRERGTKTRLFIVGDGPPRDRYRRMAGGDPYIHFAGRVPDGLPGYYTASTIYACPATRGSFGITLLESMACGTPVVCYDTPGFRTLVRHDHEALMTPPGDVESLAGALARVLEDDALRARLSAAGRRHAASFAWPRIADRVLDVYARLLQSESLAA
jgi:phosphatidylinositol alpha-mannosyltransferase